VHARRKVSGHEVGIIANQRRWPSDPDATVMDLAEKNRVARCPLHRLFQRRLVV
jgi:hypothetical protein